MSAETRLRAHLRALGGERHPVTSPEALAGTDRYVTGEFRRFGLDVVRDPFEALGGTHYNVIGTLGSQQGTLPLILAAHYDTVAGSPGADDNASALAVLLEVASRLHTGALPRPVRFIAFSLEEANLLGSRAYVAHLKETRQSIAGAIVLECVGYARDDDGSQTIPPGIPVPVPTTGNFLAVIGNEASAGLTTAVARAAHTHVPVVPLVVPGNGESLPDTRRSDHTSFWERGFPAVMLTDTANFRNPHYHQPTDTLDTLNLNFMAAVADAVTDVILAGAELREEA